MPLLVTAGASDWLGDPYMQEPFSTLYVVAKVIFFSKCKFQDPCKQAALGLNPSVPPQCSLTGPGRFSGAQLLPSPITELSAFPSPSACLAPASLAPPPCSPCSLLPQDLCTCCSLCLNVLPFLFLQILVPLSLLWPSDYPILCLDSATCPCIVGCDTVAISHAFV